MFQKVRLHLALLCAGITVIILLAMSCGYLYISERNLRNNSYTSFKNDMNTLVSNLEQQTVITHEWLNKIEDHGKYQIHIIDNGIPFLFNDRSSKEEQQAFQSALEYYSRNFEAEPASSYRSVHTEFLFSSAGTRRNDHYACVVVSEQNNGIFQVVILASMEPLLHQIHTQRILFLLLDALAATALSLFAWYFTGLILKPLEENQRKQAQFIASASHELRTPLAVMMSCASAAAQASEREQTHFLDSIQSEGLRMSRLVDDMLLLSSADSHNWTIKKTSVELDTLLLNAFEAFEPMAARKSINLLISLPDTAVLPVSCDQERIRQVLDILIHNALSYTPEGGRIQLTLLWDGKNVQLRVSDTGIGISDEEKKHIFERFYRSDRSRSQKDHFGLGLCIASEIVKAHHGQLLVSDTPEGGSTFTVIL